MFLAYVDEAGLRPPGLTEEKAKQVHSKLQQRARRHFLEEKTGAKPQREVDELVTQMAFHFCFAALQGGSEGATASQVAQKTGLPLATLTPLLEQMSRAGFVSRLTGNAAESPRYRALDAHRIIEKMASPEAFHTFMLNWMSQLLRNLAAEGPKPEDLYNVSTISVQSADRPALRRRLIEAIDSIVEEFESNSGDDLVSLSLIVKGH